MNATGRALWSDLTALLQDRATAGSLVLRSWVRVSVYLLGVHPLLGGIGVGELHEGEAARFTCGVKMAGTEMKRPILKISRDEERSELSRTARDGRWVQWSRLSSAVRDYFFHFVSTLTYLILSDTYGHCPLLQA